MFRRDFLFLKKKRSKWLFSDSNGFLILKLLLQNLTNCHSIVLLKVRVPTNYVSLVDLKLFSLLVPNGSSHHTLPKIWVCSE
ncbi:hypothetical protein LEP1GSC168_1309 [Leptospira santarosai str. HAI134]|nr:hypothetical protein LEP1GSC168_1309 [Leptospira santarosai str. HAI134]